ncbi:MAG: hypothetical protein CMO74_08330 [Verrucomicrobiales bacterium]|nr:hypothetical protein [Verrucomicrobiales bacterium]
MDATSQPSWAGLFPDRDFQFTFGARPGNAEAFFASTDRCDELLAARALWLDANPTRHLLSDPSASQMVEECSRLAKAWQGLNPEGLEDLGRQWEPDFILLAPDDKGRFVMRAAVVCFPSSWAPETKLGLPVHEIHVPVPTLNRDLGGRIDKFLAGIKPGAAWERANWGLSRSSELNQHPARDLPKLDPPFDADEAWVRIEKQVLHRLPETGGILFGIRLLNVSLAEVMSFPPTAAGLRRAIATMPVEIADYKNITPAREYLLRLLTGGLS